MTPTWEKQYGGAANDLASGVALDTAGNIYVIGTIDKATDLGGGPLAVPHGSAALLAKLGPDGTHQWSHTIDADVQVPPIPRGVAVTGEGQSAVAFDSGDSTAKNVPSIKAFADNGDVLWGRVGDEGRLWRAFAVTATDMYVAEGADTGWPDVTMANAVHVLHFDEKTGAPVSEVTLGALDTGETFAPEQLVVSPATDGLALVGALVGRTDVGDGVRDAEGVPAALVVRLHADGTLAWSRLLRGAETSRIHFGASGNIVVVGTTKQFVDFGSGPEWVKRALEPFTYLAVFGPDGTLVQHRLVDAAVADLEVAPDGTIYLAGFGRISFQSAATNVAADGNGAWMARLESNGAFASAWTNPLMEYGLPRIALGNGRLVIAGGMAPRGPNGLEDVQWDVAVYGAP